MTSKPTGFTEHLMNDALFLREFIAARGLYSKEILNANKALLASIEKAKSEAAKIDGPLQLGADTESALLTAMGDVLRHLKCTKIDDLRRADTRNFKLALSAGRIVVFATMFLCITLALPLTLAFNQLTSMTKEIEASLTPDVIADHVDNVSHLWSHYQTLSDVTIQRNNGAEGYSEEDWKGILTNFEQVTKAYYDAEYKVELQKTKWQTVAVPPTILTPLFGLLDVLSPEQNRSDGLATAKNGGDAMEKTLGQEIALFTSDIVPVKRKSDALSFLLNNAVLPLLYGMLGSAVFLSRRYMSAANELLSSNPVADALMRIGLGGMAGLIVGWFQTPDGVQELTTTPFVIAFVAGFSIDIVFSLLERVVTAFDFRQPAA